MKCHYFLLVTALALFVDVDAFGWDGKAGDEETKKERTVCHRKNETSLQEPRYEMIDDFLLDKYTGNVFYVYVLFSKTEKILLDRESAGSDVVPDHEHVNYQLIVKRDVTDSYYLLNLVSGDMWYIRNVSSKKARVKSIVAAGSKSDAFCGLLVSSCLCSTDLSRPASDLVCGQMSRGR